MKAVFLTQTLLVIINNLTCMQQFCFLLVMIAVSAKYLTDLLQLPCFHLRKKQTILIVICRNKLCLGCKTWLTLLNGTPRCLPYDFLSDVLNLYEQP